MWNKSGDLRLEAIAIKGIQRTPEPVWIVCDGYVNGSSGCEGVWLWAIEAHQSIECKNQRQESDGESNLQKKFLP